jgi:hypothetical protein
MNDLHKIIEWLKANGKLESDDNAYFRCHDEPYMQFSAEWQDWGEHEILLLGYFSIENGDVCYDPQFAFRFGKDGSLTDCSFQNDLVGIRFRLTTPQDQKEAFDFADLVYHRHMKPENPGQIPN